jgi:hypothetical protein
LYSGCIETNRSYPHASAAYSAFANRQAAIVDAPRYRTTPSSTRWVSAESVSSRGTSSSQRWIW